MRTGCLLVAAMLSACGGDAAEPKQVVESKDAGRDSGVDAGREPVEASGGQGGTDAQPSELGGSGGADEPTAGSGGMAAGGSGGKPETPPEGGAGAKAEPTGGSPAPVEHVLWSQEWTVEVHEATAYGATEGDTMGLILDAGQGCRFGNMGAASGSTQTYETDGTCITASSAPSGSAAFFSADGKTGGATGREYLVGWKEAVTGHTVKSLRRTQTYEIQLLGSGDMRWNYADFSGKWEALGF